MLHEIHEQELMTLESQPTKYRSKLLYDCHDQFLPVGHWFKGGSEV